MKNICLITLQVGNWYKDTVKYSIRGKAEYATKHGIDFKVYEEEIYGVEENRRDPPWYKIKAILDALEKGYSYVIWMDADTHILNNYTTPQDIISLLDNPDTPGSSHYLPYVETKDIGIVIEPGRENVLNTGFMVIRNTVWGKGVS